MSFQIPLHFEDLTRHTNSQWQVSPSNLRSHSSQSLLDTLSSDIAPIFEATACDTHFNSLYTVISRYTSLTTAQKGSLLDVIEKLVQMASLEKPDSIKIASYFAAGLAVTASSSTVQCKFWDKSARNLLLETTHQLVSSIPSTFAFNDSDKDQIASLLVRTILQVLEQPSASKDKSTRALLSKLLAFALIIDQKQNLPATTALLHALNRHEHLGATIADILYQITKHHEPLTSFVSEFIREVARLPSEDLARDTSAAKSVASFLATLPENLSQLCTSNLALLLLHLDGESYIVRNGIIHVIGALICQKRDAEDPLLQVLLERAHRDVHAFSRSKAMQTWILIANSKAIPVSLYPSLAEMATARLEDKAVAVRKYATQLLCVLLQNNPFGPSLRRSNFEAHMDEIAVSSPVSEESLESTPPTDIDTKSTIQTEGPESEQTATETELTDTDSISELQERGDLGTERNSPGDKNDEEPSSSPDELISEQENDAEVDLKRKYYASSLLFITRVEKGLGTLYNMLRSKSVTDVAEAVSFLIIAVQFQLEAASGTAVRKMLPLILARENGVRQIAVKAYVKLLCPGGLELAVEKESALAIAKGIVALGLGATTGELACLEALVSAMFQLSDSNIISPAVIAVLWDLFEGRIPGATEAQRRTACILVGMIAGERPQTLQQKIPVLESIGICDIAYARWSCAAMCKLPECSDKDDRLSIQLSTVIKSSHSMSTVEQAVSAIFRVSPEPERVIGVVVRDLDSELRTSAKEVKVLDLTRFFVVVGHVAVKELVRIESLIGQARKNIAEQAKSDGNQDEEERANAEGDKALELAEKELVNGSSFLGRYMPLARKVASDNSAQPILQASAVLCLAKLMCVQENFCESNLRLLFSILSKAEEPLVRANAVTALGDLAFRFPNLVEPWSSNIYSSLRDRDERVRKNTLMTLTHLILNDMIKVKGQIVGLAMCLLDESDRIVELASIFFNELSRKAANAIYNILPDTISCMSKMDDLSKEGFEKVASFLIGIMDREKHADGLAEKLCHRFRTSESKRETEQLTYCISILKMSERGLKKLNENFKSYSSNLAALKGNENLPETSTITTATNSVSTEVLA